MVALIAVAILRCIMAMLDWGLVLTAMVPAALLVILAALLLALV